MRKGILVFVILIAGACLWLVVREPSHRLNVRTFVHNPQGLQPGARVHIDGVDVGSVRDIRASTQLGEGSSELRMILRTPYALSIPADAVVSLQTEGVLGPTFVEIDTRKASGAPIAQDGVLRSVEFNLSKEAAAQHLR